MVFGCCAKVSKVLLFAINIIFFLTGAGVLGIGLWLKFDKNVEDILSKVELLKDVYTLLTAAAYILIAFGAIIFVVGFCGCCGAIKESKCLMGIYIAFIVVILIGELAGGIYAYANYEKVINGVTKEVVGALNGYDPSQNRTSLELPWNYFMVHFTCCGWDNSTDFAVKQRVIRGACCYSKDRATYPYGEPILPGSGNCDTADSKKALDTPCLTALMNIVKDNAVIAIAVVGGIAGLEILVFIMALCFCCGLDKE